MLLHKPGQDAVRTGAGSQASTGSVSSGKAAQYAGCTLAREHWSFPRFGEGLPGQKRESVGWGGRDHGHFWLLAAKAGEGVVRALVEEERRAGYKGFWNLDPVLREKWNL